MCLQTHQGQCHFLILAYAVAPAWNALSFDSFNKDVLNAYCVPDTVPKIAETHPPFTQSVQSGGEASKGTNN